MLLDLGLVQATLQARTPNEPGVAARSSAAIGEVADPLAAVAVIFRTGENGSELLVIERALHDRDPWSGHLAFPGGRSEPGDASALFTAKRETQEELALDLDRDATLLGALEPVSTRNTGLAPLSIAPFAFAIRGEPRLTPHPREVANVFWVPVGPLLRGERDTTIVVARRDARYTMPGYDVEGRVLWGLSYQMLRSFFALLHGE